MAHRVVVIGGGFGGLYATKALRGAHVALTLVDRRNHHLFQPLLYQVATGELSPADIAFPLRVVFSRQKNVQVLMAEAQAIDVPGRRILLDRGELSYDSLIVATGAQNHYFGSNHWQEFAPGLKSIEEATRIRHRILYAFEAAERETDPDKRRAWLTFVVVGAGATGVELAGALGEIANDTLHDDFRSIRPEEARILLLDGSERVLQPFAPGLSSEAERALIRLGVRSLLNTKVTSVDRYGVGIQTQHGADRIEARTILWAAGVTVSEFTHVLARATGAEVDRGGRIIVDTSCNIPGHPEIFVIGDIAHFKDKEGKPLPGVSPTAMQQGQYVAGLIRKRLRGQTSPPFVYFDKGILAVIGRASAVAQFGRVHLTGVLAWLIWLFVHLMYLVGFQNRIVVFIRWGFQYATYNRGARIITGHVDANRNTANTIKPMPSFFIQNFGCRASQADGSAIESMLAHEGMSAAASYRLADTVILNTCTVTESADTEVRHIIRRIHRDNPSAAIVVTGCYAQRAPDELIQLEGVSLVIGNSHKTEIARLLATPYHGQVHATDIFSVQDFLATPVEDALSERSRPTLKIQDGCNNRCSFCIIPSVRGRSRSASVSQVIGQVRDLSKRYPEVVLTGINLGRWGREPGSKQRLADLLRLLLSETDIQRLRLSSVEPMDWSDDLLQLTAESARIADHVHAPLQSGSDAVLRRMHRKYRPKHYASRIRQARELMPDAAIGADVMTGFPGETEAEFQETVEFVESLPFTYLHIFPYSERPGTPASESADSVPWPVRKERGRILNQMGQRKNLEFRQEMSGRVARAVTMRGNEAMTSNYLTVELATPRPPRQITEVRIGSVTATGLSEHTALSVS